MRSKPALDVAETARILGASLPRNIPVVVRTNPRAKGIVLRLVPDRGLEVVAPRGVGADFLIAAVASRQAWIAAMCDKLAAEGGLPGDRPAPPPPKHLVLTAFDRHWRVAYLPKDRPACELAVRGPNDVVVSGAVQDSAAVAAALGAFCRDRAGTLLRESLARISREAGLPYAGVTIRAQKTRWGSCTAKGRLSLNYTIAFLPWELCRLVMLHELCHTVELNHSTRFWGLLETYVPGCRELDARLNTARHYLPLWLAG